MNALIEGLLSLARLQRKELRRQRIDLSTLADEAIAGLRCSDPARSVDFVIPRALLAQGDPALLAVVLENLLGNAWKFTTHASEPRIELERDLADERPFFVRDNGAGFDPAEAAEKLFTPFQRLHSEREFEGTGIGLATVQRIITRHGGRIWADAAAGRGATFFFTLPEDPIS